MSNIIATDDDVSKIACQAELIMLIPYSTFEKLTWMTGNKREFYCLEENLKNSWIFINSCGSCPTPSDGSQKYPDLQNEQRRKNSLLIGMQDLTPNKLFVQ